MFFRNIGLAFAFALLGSFSAAVATSAGSVQQEATVQAKRQDRLTPAGGFAPQQVQVRTGYGTDLVNKG